MTRCGVEHGTIAAQACHDGQYQNVRHAWSVTAQRWVCPGERVVIHCEFGDPVVGELLPFTGNSYRVRLDDGREAHVDWHVYRATSVVAS